jgi:uncharacterized membrane protein
MPPDFLNSREDAALVCIAAVISFAVVKDPRGIGGSAYALLRAAVHPKLLLLFGSAALYSAGLVYAANEAHLWHSAALKETVYWFVGTGIVLVGTAVSQAAPTDARIVGQVVKRVFAATLLIEFIANLYALPLGFELVLVPLAFLFVAMRAIGPTMRGVDERTLRFIDGVLASIGVVYLVYFVVRALGDLEALLTRDNAEEFLVGPVLTITLLPFLYGVAWLSRRERVGARKSIRVSRSQFGEEWPFTVEEGILRGRGWGSVTFKARGEEFAVNGVAKGQGFKDIEVIWANDPETGLKKNIGPIIERGLELCA